MAGPGGESLQRSRDPFTGGTAIGPSGKTPLTPLLFFGNSYTAYFGHICSFWLKKRHDTILSVVQRLRDAFLVAESLFIGPCQVPSAGPMLTITRAVLHITNNVFRIFARAEASFVLRPIWFCNNKLSLAIVTTVKTQPNNAGC